MNIHSKELLIGETKCTLTVVTTPSNATCVLTVNGIQYTTKSLEVKKGTVVNYSVSYSNTTTKTGSVTMNSNKTLTFTRTYSTSTIDTFDTNYSLDGTASIKDSYIAYNNSSTVTSASGVFFTKRQLDANDVGKSIEYITRIKMPSSYSTSTSNIYMFDCGRSATGGPYNLCVYIRDGDLCMRGGSGSASYVTASKYFTTSTWYYLKCTLTTIGSTSAWTTYKSTNGTSWTQVLTTNRSWNPTTLSPTTTYPDCNYIRIGSGYNHNGSLRTMEIDLSKTTLKVGDEYIYKGLYSTTSYTYYFDLTVS